MDWYQKKKKLRLNAVDWAVLSQCRINMGELVSQTGEDITPFRSLLFYLLCRRDFLCDSAPQFWEYYRQMLQLARERDQHYRTVYIPKSGGGKRTLHIPDDSLICQQRYIRWWTLSELPVSSHAYAYHSGGSMAGCAKPHVRHEILIHLDIRNFFGSIRENMVFRCLERDMGYPKKLAKYLSRLCCYKGYLPQGACTSPALSNICFRDCDDAIHAFAENNELVYSRYADDLFLSGNGCDPTAVIGAVRDILGRWGFLLNARKTKVLRRNTAQRVLGLTVNEKMQVSRSYRRALRQELYYLNRYGSEAAGVKNAADYLSYLCQLQGKIAYVLSVDCENREFLKAKEEICSRIRVYSQLRMK